MNSSQSISVAAAAAAAAKSLQPCLTLCNPTDGSPPGSPVPEILQVRTLEWVAISFSNAWKWKAKVKSLGRARLLVTPQTAAYQAPPSMGFSRQDCWSGASGIKKLVHFPEVLHITQNTGESYLQGKKKVGIIVITLIIQLIKPRLPVPYSHKYNEWGEQL